MSLLKGGKTFRAPIGKWCLNGFLFNGNYRVPCFGGLFWSVAIPPTVDVDGFPPGFMVAVYCAVGKETLP